MKAPDSDMRTGRIPRSEAWLCGSYAFPARQTGVTERQELQDDGGWEPVLRSLVGGGCHGTLALLRLPPNLVPKWTASRGRTDSPNRRARLTRPSYR